MNIRRVIGLTLLAGILYVAFTQERDKKAQTETKITAHAPSSGAVGRSDKTSPLMTASKNFHDIKPAEYVTSKWQYLSNQDEMRGTKNTWAIILSDNRSDVGPYRTQIVQMKIEIRHMPKKYGLDVILSIPEGQIHCRYDGCKIPMKFDDGPIITYTADRAESGYQSIFIREKEGFVRRIKKAKKMIIEIPVWKKGSQQFTFSPAGLDWEITPGK